MKNTFIILLFGCFPWASFAQHLEYSESEIDSVRLFELRRLWGNHGTYFTCNCQPNAAIEHLNYDLVLDSNDQEKIIKGINKSSIRDSALLEPCVWYSIFIHSAGNVKRIDVLLPRDDSFIIDGKTYEMSRKLKKFLNRRRSKPDYFGTKKD